MRFLYFAPSSQDIDGSKISKKFSWRNFALAIAMGKKEKEKKALFNFFKIEGRGSNDVIT